MKWLPNIPITGRVVRRDGVVVFIPFANEETWEAS